MRQKAKQLVMILSLCLLQIGVVGQSDSGKSDNKVLGIFDGVTDKVDFSLKQGTSDNKYRFSLGYRVYAYNKLPPFEDRDWKARYIGPVLTAQALFGDKTLFTPKLGYRLSYNGYTVQTDIGLNTDFEKVSYSITPGIGLSLLEAVGVYYEYDFQVGKQKFTDIGKHRFGLWVPSIILATLLPSPKLALSDKLDLSLKQDAENDKYHFSLGYRLFLYNEEKTVRNGPVLTTQVVFADRTLFTPKLGYRLVFNNENLITPGIQIDGGLNTDFSSTSYSVTPSVSLSIQEALGLYYEYDHQLGAQKFESIGKHRIGFFVSPIEVITFLNTSFSK